MRARIVRCLIHATAAGFASALVLVAVLGPALTGDQPIPNGQQKQTDEDRCKFLMENVNATILSLNTAGEITFLNRYGQRFFGYSNEEILGKADLGYADAPCWISGSRPDNLYGRGRAPSKSLCLQR